MPKKETPPPEATPKTYRIVKLESQNVKRLKAIAIRPTKAVTIVGGDNGEGKTSVLDSIAWAIGGAKLITDEPIRRGEKKAITTIELGDLTIIRSYTEKGTQLEIRDKGVAMASPQAILEKLTGRVSFDPVEFLNMASDKQLATLKEIVGLDFSEMDAKRLKYYSERTVVNRDLEKAKATLSGCELYGGVPTEPLDPADLAIKVAEARQKDELLDTLETQGRDADSLVDEIKADIEALQKKYEAAVTRRDSLRENYRDTKKALEGIPLAGLEEKLANVNSTNEKIASNKRRGEQAKLVDEFEAEVATFNKLIGDIDASKEKLVSSAKFPVPGLGFSDKGILFNSIPFEQASSAQRLRTSVAIGMALNPSIRVMLIRDGSLLDEKNLELIEQMAEESGFQVWLEKVGEGQECSVIIEDGTVVEDRTEDQAKLKTKGPKFAK